METLNLDLIEALNIKYEAKFVPFSQSRNKDNKDKSLNWIVTLTRNGTTLETDYMQGSGHIKLPKMHKGCDPSYWKRRVIPELISGACEKRVIPKRVQSNFHINLASYKKIPSPTLKDVLYSLLMDSDVLNYESFEDWADCFGYDHDSRSAEKTYQACLAIALKVIRMFNESERESLAEFYQDY